jgi:hypothetical protein
MCVFGVSIIDQAMADNNWGGPPNTGSAAYGFAAIGAFFGGSFVAAYVIPYQACASFHRMFRVFKTGN